MEMLPAEMVLEIGQLLTAEDLTRCCGVSREWREAFNQDQLWRPHCDPALEEHLRTTPSTVEPVFTIPDHEGSTLAPLCRWRVAFLRGKHLRNNWKHNYHRTDSLMELKNELYREFLTNTLIVRWLKDGFEVWDVSGTPAVFLAKTEPSDGIEGWIDCYVEKGFLIVRQIGNVKVFFVDVGNKRIQLKQNILLEDVGTLPPDSEYHQRLLSFQQPQLKDKSRLDCVKGNLFLHINARSNLDIFDLETGLKVKEEVCPVPVYNATQKAEIMEVMTSSTSDLVIVIVRLVDQSRIYSRYCYYYVYNPQKQCFFKGCMVHRPKEHYCELYSHYLALGRMEENQQVTVYDCQSFKKCLRAKVRRNVGFYKQGSEVYFLLIRCGREELEMFNLISQTVKTVEILMPMEIVIGLPGHSSGSMLRPCQMLVLNNQLLVCQFFRDRCYFMSENGWMKSDFFLDRPVINQAFTKMLSNKVNLHDMIAGLLNKSGDKLEEECYIYHKW